MKQSWYVFVSIAFCIFFLSVLTGKKKNACAPPLPSAQICAAWALPFHSQLSSPPYPFIYLPFQQLPLKFSSEVEYARGLVYYLPIAMWQRVGALSCVCWSCCSVSWMCTLMHTHKRKWLFWNQSFHQNLTLTVMLLLFCLYSLE